MVLQQYATQRRGRSIAMTHDELDSFLSEQRVCRVATVGLDGPHVAPMWFYWDGRAIWLNSVVQSQRWKNLTRDPRLAIVVDDGGAFGELRGVEVKGDAEIVGEVPRVGHAGPRLSEVEHGFHLKYRDPETPIPHDGKHAWLLVNPDKLTSWDFRKINTRKKTA